MRRLWLVTGSLVCLGLAAALFLLAADVSRWPGVVAAGDLRYRVAPEQADLWRPRELLPFGLARRLLGVEDDLAFREALRAVRLARLQEGFYSDPKLALLRGDAQRRLQAIVAGDADRGRRSRALGLLGVLSFASALTEGRDRATLLQEAVADFQAAIALDPDNDEAKANLELALQRGRGLQAAEGAGGPNPSPGGSGAEGAGAGTPGSGY